MSEINIIDKKATAANEWIHRIQYTEWATSRWYHCYALHSTVVFL